MLEDRNRTREPWYLKDGAKHGAVDAITVAIAFDGVDQAAGNAGVQHIVDNFFPSKGADVF